MLVFYLFIHVFGQNIINIGNISNLPAIISIDNNIFEKSENSANEPIGPTAPKPGPTLLIHVRDAVKVVIKSFPSIEINNATAINLAQFISKTTSNKGFYIARYEAGKEGTDTVVSKKGAYVYNNVLSIQPTNIKKN